MARRLTLACLIYAALAWQPGLETCLREFPFRIWLPGLALAGCLLLAHDSERLVWAGLLGFGIDCLSGQRLGIHLILTTLVGILLSVCIGIRSSPGPLSVGFIVFAGTTLWRGGSAALHGILEGQSSEFVNLARSASADGLLTALIAFVLAFIGRLCVSAAQPTQRSSLSLKNRWSMLTGE